MKKIPLTHGKFALVDDEDFEYLNQWKWHSCTKGYAKRSKKFVKDDGKISCKSIFMHKLILNVKYPLQVDHIDLNKSNNQKSNLRVATNSENACNRLKIKSSNNKFKGVWKSKKGKYYARIFRHKKCIHLGHFKTEIDAAMAYNKAALIEFGKFARLNII